MNPAIRMKNFWNSNRSWLICQTVSWLIIISVVVFFSMSLDDDGDLRILTVGSTVRGLVAIPAALGLLLAWKRDREKRALLILDAVGSAGAFLTLAFFPRSNTFSTIPEVIGASAGSLCMVAGILSYTGILLIDVHLLRLHAVAVIGAARALALHPALQQRGYYWLTLAQARELWELCGERAFKLPPWADVGILPGIAEGDLRALAHLAGMAHD